MRRDWRALLGRAMQYWMWRPNWEAARPMCISQSEATFRVEVVAMESSRMTLCQSYAHFTEALKFLYSSEQFGIFRDTLSMFSLVEPIKLL